MTLKLKQNTTVEWEGSNKRLVISDVMPIPGNIEGDFYYFKTRLGQARLPLKCFILPENTEIENG